MSVEVQYYALADKTFDYLESFAPHYWMREDEGFRRQTDQGDPEAPDFVAFGQIVSDADEGRLHYLGKDWAGLYYLYTGYSDANWKAPEDDNPLNFAGLRKPLETPKAVHPDECSYLRHETLWIISERMREFDNDRLRARFDHDRMNAEKVYPKGSWKAADVEYLLKAHDDLQDYFDQCVKNKLGALCWVCA